MTEKPLYVFDIKASVFQDTNEKFKFQIYVFDQYNCPMKGEMVQWFFNRNDFFILAGSKRTDKDGIALFDFAFLSSEMRVKVNCGIREEIFVFKIPQVKEETKMPLNLKGHGIKAFLSGFFKGNKK